AGRPTGAVLRAVARLADEAVTEHMVADEQERRPETLDLQRPCQLYLDAVPDTLGRKHEEGHEEQRDDRKSDPEAAHRLPPATPLPGVYKPEWKEHDGVEL